MTPELKRKSVCVEDPLLGNRSTNAKKKAIYLEGNASNDDDTDPSVCAEVAPTPAVDIASWSNQDMVASWSDQDMVAQPVWGACLASERFQGIRSLEFQFFKPLKNVVFPTVDESFLKCCRNGLWPVNSRL